MPFKSPSISHDVRLACLLKLAIRNLINVQTLRVLYGHWLVTIGLIIGFFDRCRSSTTRVRKLWLENCSVEGIFKHELEQCDFSGLESVRFRRMRLAPEPTYAITRKVLMRGGIEQPMHNGKGDFYYTTLHDEYDVSMFNSHLSDPSASHGLDIDHGGYLIDPKTVFHLAESFDKDIYGKFSEISELVKDEDLDQYIKEHENMWKVDNCAESRAESQRQIVRIRAGKNAPTELAGKLLAGSMDTLTNLNLDWIFLVAHQVNKPARRFDFCMPLLEDLLKLRFPHLRAFQLRNAVTNGTILHDLVPLFGTSGLSFLDFIEWHQNLKCLGWPMPHFFTGYEETADVRYRIDQAIEKLSDSLIDLRIDAPYNDSGEPQSQMDDRLTSLAERKRRRLFITNFASRMQKVEHIKIEGCIPRDERRETFRALRKCQLRRIISIGVSSPLGNTWGEGGVDIRALDEGHFTTIDFLEAEDTDAIMHGATSPLGRPQESYITTFGWGPSPPLLHTIASYHAANVTELKFCGYQGSPILGSPTPITDSFLYPLRHFHNLRQLVLSMWLITFFEDNWQDRDIIDYWMDMRDSSSTALVPITDETPGPWALRIKEKYAPEMLAKQVRDIVAQHLSPRAKEREGGVRVRASFSLGFDTSNNIFDIDVGIGRDDQIFGFKGPREELEPERRTEKLESRRWF